MLPVDVYQIQQEEAPVPPYHPALRQQGNISKHGYD